MSEFVSAYCTLISSPTQVAQCREAATLAELLHIIKRLWNIPGIEDNQLLAELSLLNRQILEDRSVRLAGTWLPYRYNAASRSVYWCLPNGPATEPFQDEAISRYRTQIPLNTILQPQTSLKLLDQQASGVANTQPAGFIFHLSRCGSTLVSGCLSELDSTCIFSESPVLTEVLLDPELDAATQRQCLRQLIDLQACVFPDRPNVIIKWNAWDIFRWKLIRDIYPRVPSVFLVRNPSEILASHQRSAGRHMSGDPALGFVNPTFKIDPILPFSLLDFRIGVLSALLAEMQSIGNDGAILRLDYSQLDLARLVEIGEHFGIQISQAETGRIKARLAFNSKSPDLPFDQDSEQKRNSLDAADKARIQQAIAPLYDRFIEPCKRC